MNYSGSKILWIWQEFVFFMVFYVLFYIIMLWVGYRILKQKWAKINTVIGLYFNFMFMIGFLAMAIQGVSLSEMMQIDIIDLENAC